MAQVFNLPIARVFKNDGSVAPGYQLFFYETGTTTKKTIYSDEDLTTPLTNPVVADANGEFTQIFLEGSGALYKAVLGTDTEIDPPSSPVWTADPVDVLSLDANSLNPRPAQHWGTTSGTADDYTLTPKDSLPEYTDDLLFSMQMHLTNNIAPTIAISELDNPGNFLPAINLKKYDNSSSKVDLEAEDLKAGQTYIVRIDGSDAVVLNPGIPYINLLNSTEATTTTKGISYLYKQITFVNNVTDSNNDIDFISGTINFDDGTGQAISSDLTKQFDATFALGNNTGGMVEGVTKTLDTWYYLFAISNEDGNLTDYIADDNEDGTNIPSDTVVIANSLTKKELKGAFLTDGSVNIIDFGTSVLKYYSDGGVIEDYRNNDEFYTKYRSGLINQSGSFSYVPPTVVTSIPFPIAFSDTRYSLNANILQTNVSGADGKNEIALKTTTGFNYEIASLINNWNNTVISIEWQAEGY